METCAFFLAAVPFKDSKNLYETLLVQHNIHHTISDYIRLFQHGDEKGFNFFFREYYAALSYFSFKMVKDKQVAEEIAGEALMKLWERRTGFDNFAAIKSFLYTTTRNASLNRVRQQHRESKRLTELAYLSEDSVVNTFEGIVEAETMREIFLSINTLPPQCRKIFSMLFIEGKSTGQIAKELNLSIVTIRRQKSIALQLLAKRIAFGLLIFSLILLF